MKNSHKDKSDHALITTDVQIDKGMPRDRVIQRGREHAQSYGAAAKHLSQAIDALNTKDYQRAIGAFQQALQHNRESAEGHFYLGLTYFMVGDYEEASASYKRAIMCEPSDPMIHLNLGIVYQLQERYDDAVGSYQRSIALAPNNAEVYSRLGSVYTAQGKRQEAVTAYKNAVRIKLLTDTKSETDS